MKILLRTKWLSTAYYFCCMLALTLYTYLNLQGMERDAEPMRGTRMLSALCLLFSFGAALKPCWISGYRIYRPPNTIIFYVLYLVWLIVPTMMFGIGDGSLSDTVYGLTGELMPVCTVLITYNYLMNHGENRWLRWFFCFMWAVYAYGFFRIMLELLSFGAFIQMVVSYFTLYMLPLIMLTSGKKTRVVFIILTMLVLTVSMKRGGLVAFACGLVAYGVVYILSSKKIRAGMIIAGIVFFALFAGLFIALGTSEESNVIERFEGMENDEGSGRISVWKTTIRMIVSSDPATFVIGHGYDKVYEDSPLSLSAHNDFLEVTYDYGLVGLVLYLCAGLLLFRMVALLVKRKSGDAPAAAMFFTVYFILSMISHIIIYPWANIILLTVSYICAREKLACKEQTG